MADKKFEKYLLCIGAGYVGGPTMAMIAAKCPQYKVTVVDINEEKIKAWQTDKLPIYEPGLLDVVKIARGRNLFFSTDLEKNIKANDPLPEQAKPLSEMETGSATDLSNSNFYATKGLGNDNQVSFQIAVQLFDSLKLGDSFVKDSNDDFILTTKFKAETGNSVQVYDGYAVTFPLKEILFGFQNKLNPTLNVDGTGDFPIYNRYFFLLIGITDFDANTMLSGIVRFIYDSNEQAWLWSNEESTISAQLEAFNSIGFFAGYIPLDGSTLLSGTSGDYPNMVLEGFFADSTTTIDLTDCSLAGYSAERPIDTINEGQIENITGKMTGVLGDYDVPPSGTEAFDVGARGGTLVGGGFPTVEVDTFEFLLDASLSVNTGTKTMGPTLSVVWNAKI